jgi:MFS family permease
MLAYVLSITKLERSALLYIIAFSAVGFGYIGVTSVIGNLYVLGLGFDTSFLGTLTASGQLVWALTALPAGAIGARFGLRGTVIAGFALIALFFMAYINVPLLPREAWSAGLIFSNILMWASVSLVSVNGLPYLMSVTPEEERSKAFTFQAAVMPVTAFIGSLLGGFLPGYLMNASGSLGETGAYRIVLALPVLAYLIAVALLFNARPAPLLEAPAGDAARQTAPVGLMLFLGVLFGIQFASEGTLMTYMNVYFSRDLLVSTGLIGTIFAVVRLMPFFISPLLPLALNRWGSGFTMTASYVLMAAAAACMAFFHDWIVAGAAFIMASIASSTAIPARNLLSQESVQPRWRTTINAVSIISLAAGLGLSGYIGGILIETIGFQGLFLVSAALALGVVVLYAAGRRKKIRQPAPTINEVQA